MVRSPILAATLVLSLNGWTSALGDEVRYYEKDGVTYRETRRVVQRPILETQTRESTRTVYREEYTTQMRESVRKRWTPVTEYRQEAYWVNRWNPFAQPYVAHRYVPRTRWEQSTETVKTPVTCRRLVPETQTVRVPVTTQRLVNEETITRVAVGGSPTRNVPWTAPSSTTPSSMARLVPVPKESGPIGGTARLESDPPRQGTNTAWRPSETRRR